MTDIVKRLPDHVANQIAAGEVIQRPASVVKELLENSIDSGATKIDLIIKDAGKTLIQVVDNGKGMSPSDAKLCFERHATSKISTAEDLFNIATKGFRGEALASIAAIAHVELKTKEEDAELGYLIEIEGSEIKTEEETQFNPGTSISVKNLFYNVPARRNFLKTDSVETRHIIDEFTRVALIHPDIAFSMTHNDNEVYNLPVANFKQRIVGIFGKRFNERLAPVAEKTDIVRISGFIGKPEYARKSRGEQFFFANGRFIKSGYLHHAIKRAFQGLIKEDHYPTYFIKLEVDPKAIDVNIHPTKTEVKFEEEKAIYMMLHSTVRNSIGKFNIAPSLDFEKESSFDQYIDPKSEIKPPQVEIDPTYNPFVTTKKSSNSAPGLSGTRVQSDPWKEANSMFEDQSAVGSRQSAVDSQQSSFAEASGGQSSFAEASEDKDGTPQTSLMQVHNKYIVSSIKSGVILIDQHRAHIRVLYERYIASLATRQGTSQQLMFPETVELSKSDKAILASMADEMHALGFNWEDEGDEAVKLFGVPTDIDESGGDLMESMISRFRDSEGNDNFSKNEKLAHTLASKASIPYGRSLSPAEMENLVNELFGCEQPYFTATGKPTIVTFAHEELDKRFDR